MAIEQANEGKPKYQPSDEQATSFWKELWESKGTENVSAEWLERIRHAIQGSLPQPSEKECRFGCEQVKKVTARKRNWSTSGSDQITCY